jgi:hypothetical protein
MDANEFLAIGDRDQMKMAFDALSPAEQEGLTLELRLSALAEVCAPVPRLSEDQQRRINELRGKYGVVVS